MTALLEAMLADLAARGVMFGEPGKRADLAEGAIRGWALDGQRVEVTSGEWRLVLAYIDRRYAANPDLAGGMLVRVLRSPVAWLDAVACAGLAAPSPATGDAIPSHYNAGPPPAGRCAHGKLGSEPCAECSALDSIQRPQAAPGSRRKRRPDPQSLARANRNSEAHRALYGDSGDDA